jgi:hypothetical protein
MINNKQIEQLIAHIRLVGAQQYKIITKSALFYKCPNSMSPKP